MKTLLVSTYDLGHQPFGLASPASWLRDAGAAVTCNDLAVERLDRPAVAAAALIAIYLPMHTATRLAAEIVPEIRSLNPRAHLCFFGLYAPMNAAYLRGIGGDTILGGEFEAPLTALYRRLAAGGIAARNGDTPMISLQKQRFLVPDRSTLPPLDRYAHVVLEGSRRTIGYTEASRGCKHLCRHCPVVPVYGGRFRVVQPEVVLADIGAQVAAGADHITFGDPDFFNGVGHAMRIVHALHGEFPDLTYDVTIKVEHLLGHADKLAVLVGTGCISVTTAVESVDDHVLDILAKGHTRADVEDVVRLAGAAGLTLSPTFIPFTPWMTPDGYLDLLRFVAENGLVPHVAPVQYAMRLLVPEGSLLLETPEMQAHLGEFDAARLSYSWRHPEPAIDALHETVRGIVSVAEPALTRHEMFARIWAHAHQAAGCSPAKLPDGARTSAHGQPPRFSEPWYCCAEPTETQLAGV